MSTIRITVNAPEVEQADEVKDQFFKKLFEHAGTKVVFEVPAGADAEADEIIAFAKDKGCEASKETFEDPLDDAGSVDFW